MQIAAHILTTIRHELVYALLVFAGLLRQWALRMLPEEHPARVFGQAMKCDGPDALNEAARVPLNETRPPDEVVRRRPSVVLGGLV